jgi:ribonuclease G
VAEIHRQTIGRLEAAALVEKGRVVDLAVDDREATSPRYGAVYRGRCETLRKGLGAFVRLDRDSTGFLQAGVRGAPADAGETLLVQIKQEGERTKDETDGKAPVVSREIALAGRFLVHLPAGKGVKRSKKFAGAPLSPAIEEPLAALRGGYVVRSSAAQMSPDAVIMEARALQAEAAALETRAPGRLIEGPDAVRRLLVDHPTVSLDRIAVDDRAVQEETAARLGAFAPALQARIEFDPTIDLAPFLAELRRRRVPLASGATLVIEPTEALIAVDVNAGPRADFAAVNRAAAEEIARQMRLRALAGQIVIDFLGTEKRAFREDIRPTLEALAAADPAGWQVHGFSHLGLCETTRTRRTRPLAELLRALDAAIV